MNEIGDLPHWWLVIVVDQTLNHNTYQKFINGNTLMLEVIWLLLLFPCGFYDWDGICFLYWAIKSFFLVSIVNKITGFRGTTPIAFHINNQSSLEILHQILFFLFSKTLQKQCQNNGKPSTKMRVSLCLYYGICLSHWHCLLKSSAWITSYEKYDIDFTIFPMLIFIFFPFSFWCYILKFWCTNFLNNF